MVQDEDIAAMVGTAAVPVDSRRGRGSLSNGSGRFESEQRVRQDDGWIADEDEPAPLRTTVTREFPKTVINKVDSPDVPFDRSLNPYRGCEHGCAYCFARPTHAFHGLSPGLDFETRLFAKPEAAILLRRELAKPSYVCRPLAMGTNTDPYQPIEREWQLTRQVLEVLRDCGHPVTIVTKSALILRDIDILADMAKRSLASVALSITTLDRHLARAMEPRASTPARRVDAVRQLHEAGVPVSILFAPVIPALNDHELDDIVAAAAQAGARDAGYVLLRLPYEIKDLWREWLSEHYPGRADRIMAQLRAMRGGRDYDFNWGTRQTGEGEYARLLKQRFRLALKRNGMDRRIDATLDTGRFVPPSANGQMSLF
jgi:DNA repair photolyase